MENLALVSAKTPFFSASPAYSGRRSPFPAIPVPATILRAGARTRIVVSASRQGGSDAAAQKIFRFGIESFASISSSNEHLTTATSSTPQITAPPPSSNIGSPLFWIGVGVGLTVLFTTVSSRLKRYAMQQAFKTMMDQAATKNNDAPFPGSQFPSSQSPFPPPSSASLPSQPTPVAPQLVVKVEDTPTKVDPVLSTEVQNVIDVQQEPKKYAFIDVSPEEAQKDSLESFTPTVTSSTKQVDSQTKVSSNGAAVKQDKTASSDPSRKPESVLSVEALEKMMEDPTVQQMVYPYLPEEMRNPTTFKWMLQNPQYRQQLQDMLNNMGGSSEWDKRMMDSLKNFDLSSPEVKQQFNQIGLTPEEVISKIMANPDIAMAFQNPKVQAAIMDCSQNPLSIAKYQNDKEVMDVFNKISELFPGITG